MKRDELPPAGRVTREFHCGFDCFGSGVSKEAPPGFAARHQRLQLPSELGHLLVVKIGAGHVDQLRGLPLNGSHNVGMAMSRRADGNSSTEVQEPVSVDVLHYGASTALGHEGIRTRI